MANTLAIAGPGSKYRLPGAVPAGFWAGFWHGLIAPITFVVSLFNLLSAHLDSGFLHFRSGLCALMGSGRSQYMRRETSRV